MNFKQLFENIICVEEGKITDIYGYKFYLKMGNILFPDNKVRVNENPYKTTKHIMVKTPPNRPITKSV